MSLGFQPRQEAQKGDGMRSVCENIAALDAINGEHMEAGGREVIAVIDQVSIGTQRRVSLPKTHTVLGLNPAISPFSFPNPNGLNMAVVEQSCGVRLPAVVEIERFTRFVKRTNVVLDVRVALSPS